MRTRRSQLHPHAAPIPSRARFVAFAGLALVFLVGMNNCGPNNHEPPGSQQFTSPQTNPIALSPDGTLLFVANTTSNTVSIIQTAAPGTALNVEVGIEPVSLAVKPDGSELWVSNHVSDSVSVIDASPASPNYGTVIQTVQDIDSNGVTQFDEPAGIAFASNSKAYVALSSRNDIAIVDATDYSVSGRIHITAQDPRAIAVRNGRLYVTAFESGNQTELTLCPEDPKGPSGSQCTLDTDDIVTFVVTSPNIPGENVEIIKDPDTPDRDLFVFNTSNESSFDVVSTVSTLLYGVAVDSNDRVFVAATDALNDVNRLMGENLIDMDNRMFLNQVVRVDCGGGSCGSPTALDLEPLPPTPPPAGTQLATPYGIAISDDDSTIVGTAMGTSRIFTQDPNSGAVLDILDLDAGVPADAGQQIPKGVALASNGGTGAPETAYVLNTLENTVSIVDVSNPSNLVHVQKISVGKDPTPDSVRRGRIAFANAFASESGTFSCESCHPDSHTDQLLWRIGGACFFGACSGDDEVRSTMPVKGLANTLPLHWDGTLGDPFDNTDNGAFGPSNPQPANCTGGQDCFLQLVGASLSGVMCNQTGGCAVGPSGDPGLLTTAERDDMATFLQHTVYPPARERRLDDAVTNSAIDGFEDFFVDNSGGLFSGDAGDALGVTTCADMDSGCHALPLGVDHSSSTLAGFDAPTMRGMTDRFIQFSIGFSMAEEVMDFASTSQTINILGFNLSYPGPDPGFAYDFADGYEEHAVFQTAFVVFDPVYGSGPTDMFQMFEEASTGHSGALARQVQVNQDTTTGGNLNGTDDILDALETADANGSVNLRGVGVRNGGLLVLSYRAGSALYMNKDDTVQLSQADLYNEAQAGTLNMMFTAALSKNFGHDDYRQPLVNITTIGDGNGTNPDIPLLPGDNPIDLLAIDVRGDATVFVDGVPVSATITCTGGSFTPYCDSGQVEIDLAAIPSPNGLHLLQVQNPQAGLSVELPICVGSIGQCQN